MFNEVGRSMSISFSILSVRTLIPLERSVSDAFYRCCCCCCWFFSLATAVPNVMWVFLFPFFLLTFHLLSFQFESHQMNPIRRRRRYGTNWNKPKGSRARTKIISKIEWKTNTVCFFVYKYIYVCIANVRLRRYQK